MVLGRVADQDASTQSYVGLQSLDELIEVSGVAEVVQGPEEAFRLYEEFHPDVRKRWSTRRGLEKHETGEINKRQESSRLRVREAALDLQNLQAAPDAKPDDVAKARQLLEQAEEQFEIVTKQATVDFERIRGQIEEINGQNSRLLLALRTAGEGSMPAQQVFMRLDDIVRAYPANRAPHSTPIRRTTPTWVSNWRGDGQVICSRRVEGDPVLQ